MGMQIRGQHVVGTELIFTPSKAAEFCRKHVVISRKELLRIRALAKRKGFLKELQALDISVFPFEPGDWNDD